MTKPKDTRIDAGPLGGTLAVHLTWQEREALSTCVGEFTSLWTPRRLEDLISAERKLNSGPLQAGAQVYNLPVEIESQNVVGNNRGGIMARRAYRQKRSAFHVALAAAGAGRRDRAAKGKRYVKIVRVYGKGCRAFDMANLVGGAKSLVDVLVEIEALKDDTAEWMIADYAQEKAAMGGTGLSAPRTVVMIADWYEAL